MNSTASGNNLHVENIHCPYNMVVHFHFYTYYVLQWTLHLEDIPFKFYMMHKLQYLPMNNMHLSSIETVDVFVKVRDTCSTVFPVKQVSLYPSKGPFSPAMFTLFCRARIVSQ